MIRSGVALTYQKFALAVHRNKDQSMEIVYISTSLGIQLLGNFVHLQTLDPMSVSHHFH
jgi:hypothetical protein